MTSIVVLLIIVGCAVFQFFKGTIVRAFATIIIAIFASIVAFGFFEMLASVLIKRGDSGSMLALVPWAHSLGFLLIFVLVFAVLQTAIVQLTHKKPIDLGFLPERIGRAVLGIILGFVASGVLMTFLAMAPLPSEYPYERFESRSIKVDNPNKVLLNVDGFVTGLFGVVSNGSLSGKRSFACLHPNFLNQLYLNRLDKGVSLVSGTQPAIEVPRDKAAWPATVALETKIEELNSQGKFSRTPGKPIGNYQPMIVRVGIKRTALKTDSKINAGIFTLSQLRLICKERGYEGDPLEGKGRDVYPLGYLKAADEIETSFKIQVQRDDFPDNAGTKDFDFIFPVPSGLQPVFVGFKLNNIIQIPTNAILTDASEAPPAVGSSPSSVPETPDSENQEPETLEDSPEPSEESDQDQPEAQQSGDNASQQGRVERLTESITGVQLDEDQ
jgi:hypothetical protein